MKTTALLLIAACAVLSGCAVPGSGSGDAAAFNNSPGAVNIDGDVNVWKIFGGACVSASSGYESAQEAQAQQDADAEVGAVPGIGLAAGAALISSLAAEDECRGEEQEEDS